MKTFANFHKTLLHSINFKTILFSIALVCFTQIGFGQGTETFTDIDTASTSSSISRSWTGDDGSLWAATFSRVDQNINGDALTLDDDRANTYVESGIISGGVGDITISTQRAFSGGSGNIDILINGTSVGLVPYGTSVQTTTIQNVNISGDFVIRIDNNIGGNNGGGADRVIIDDFIWTAFSGTVLPGITLGSMSGNTNEDGTTATFTAVLDAAPAGDVVVDITSGDPGEVTVSPSQLTFTTINWDTPQTITATGVDDSDLDGDIDVTITVAVDDASSDDNYDGISATTTVTNEDDDLPQIIISEIMYNSPGTDDEWIEVYNGNGDDVDISSWTIVYSGGTFTFPGSTTITNGDYITIALGSNGDGTYNNDSPFTPDFNNLSGSPSNSNVKDTNDTNKLGNTSGTITLKNGSGTSIDIVAYDDGDASSTDGGGPSYEILDTTSDNSDTVSNWQASAINGGSPGKLSSTTWTGATDTNWDTSTNWTNGQATYTKDVLIPNGLSTYPIATGNVTINSGASLTIAEEASLQVSGDFTNSGTVTLNSTEDDFSSLIVTGTATGNITYNRYVNSYNTNALGGGWDLVGAPAGMTISAFIAANGTAGSNVIKVLGDDYAFSQYDNATGQWNRYATASQTGSFTTGQGYSMATNAGDGATVAFTGAMQTTTQSINIIDNNDANAGAGRRWNLVSNPYPSYILGNAAAGANNFLSVNSAVIQGNYQALYGWNGSGYTPYNLTDGAGFSIAPGQAFWVAAESTTGELVSFTPEMRTTTGTGDFITGPQLLSYELALKLYNGESQKAKVKFYFKDGLSLDLDPGYDAGAFNQSMKLSTRLPQGSQETAFSINAMGIDALQNTRVPLEIRQNAGQAFTISIADMDLPEDIYVYLEDTLNGTFTSLKEQDFELVAQNDLSGVDRFFVVFKSNSVLSSGDTLDIDALNVYKANSDSFVTIAGISPELGKLNVSLYNILGQTVREKALSSATATQTISTDGLASGLYIVQIRSGNQVFTKKIVVK